MVVTEEFIKKLYADPNGARKIPTVFDELRHAVQHSQKPLEQVIQMISEFHGPWVGLNQNTANLLNVLLSLYSNKDSKNITSQVNSALNALRSITSQSTIGRQNNITANDMSVPMLREFVSKSQAIHPAVNAYIQNNIGKYPYFQQISEQVASLGQVVLTSKDIHPSKRVETGGLDNMTTDFPIRRNVEKKLFNNISKEIDYSTSLVNCLFLRAMKPDGSNPILLKDSNTSASHGYSYTMDVLNADRNKKAVPQCLSKAVLKFGPSIQLLNSFYPIDYEVKNTPEIYEINTETGSCYVDKLARPIVREVPIPLAKDEDVVQVA